MIKQNQQRDITMNKIVFLPIILGFLFFAGCSSSKVKDDNVQTKSNDSGATTGIVGKGDGSNVVTSDTQGDNSNFNYLPNTNNDPNNTDDITLAGLGDPNNLLSQRVIYFDYDKSAIRPEYMVLINTHAKLLAKFPSLKMRLEGHADERGSREYNVALSEARSQSVKRIMGLQGAQSAQMRTIGFGEEVPVVRGHNQDSWQKNRRVEIKYDDY